MPVDQEGEPAEHALLGDRVLAGQELADAIRQILVVGHAAGRIIGPWRPSPTTPATAPCTWPTRWWATGRWTWWWCPAWINQVEHIWTYPPGAAFMDRLAELRPADHVRPPRHGAVRPDGGAAVAGGAGGRRDGRDGRRRLRARRRVRPDRGLGHGVPVRRRAPRAGAGAGAVRAAGQVRARARIRVADRPTSSARGSWSRCWSTGATGRPTSTMLARAPGRSPELREWFARAGAPGRPPRDAAGACHEIVRGTDVRAVLPSIRVPTVVMHRPGGSGRWTLATPSYVAEHIPGAESVALPGDEALMLAEHRAAAGRDRALPHRHRARARARPRAGHAAVHRPGGLDRARRGAGRRPLARAPGAPRRDRAAGGGGPPRPRDQVARRRLAGHLRRAGARACAARWSCGAR